jgi:hypothetical protein
MSSRAVNICKDGIRDIMQRRNPKDEECCDREFWKGKKLCLWVDNTAHSQKSSFK